MFVFGCAFCLIGFDFERAVWADLALGVCGFGGLGLLGLVYLGFGGSGFE